MVCLESSNGPGLPTTEYPVCTARKSMREYSQRDWPLATGLRGGVGCAGDAAVAWSLAMTTDADRHLLFGLFALQNGIINQGQLVAAFQAWTFDKARSLAGRPPRMAA